ncbi:hypothetical protein ASPCAL07441 [Aspergillus calidoustus]|uniref:Uncharacterized protein n=1 Tax=Aspergillus calidoustus TaxID=454130 RepID=A0A0U5G9M7_ASPCI|nr:hypothetical protein ASPCAL07441 [Aspergillus calidoustus]
MSARAAVDDPHFREATQVRPPTGMEILGNTNEISLRDVLWSLMRKLCSTVRLLGVSHCETYWNFRRMAKYSLQLHEQYIDAEGTTEVAVGQIFGFLRFSSQNQHERVCDLVRTSSLEDMSPDFSQTRFAAKWSYQLEISRAPTEAGQFDAWVHEQLDQMIFIEELCRSLHRFVGDRGPNERSVCQRMFDEGRYREREGWALWAGRMGYAGTRRFVYYFAKK